MRVGSHTVRDLFFSPPAVVARTREHLQTLLDQFTQACWDFSLTISLNKTKTMGQGIIFPPAININNYTMEAMSTYTITKNLSLESELSSRIGEAAYTFGKLTVRVWGNGKLTVYTKIQVFRACAISTLLYGSETWTLYSHYKKEDWDRKLAYCYRYKM